MFTSPYYRLIRLFIAYSFLLLPMAPALAQGPAGREKFLMDFGWKFAFGHPYDTKKDFDHATGYFSYLAKAGYGDGPADAQFDDRSWRLLDVPHDWAVEASFDAKGSHSHGYKAVGRNFPEASVGWYRKTFFIPETDLGRHIILEFDGVSRNSAVWVNGFYLGTEPSGYASFQYDITDYLNYGGDNVVAVRADVTMEEGWYYEGAGIYRHVWLSKVSPLHVARYGTFVTTNVKNNNAKVVIETTVTNENDQATEFDVVQQIENGDGKIIGTCSAKRGIASLETTTFRDSVRVPDPILWSLENPYRYKLVTILNQHGKMVDRYETPFGIRTIRFDADKGFFLNDRPVKLKGTNNHQDHAGVGTAIPDALQDFRITTLKAMGSNAYRCSHNPPTPELLDACDRLGMLVLDENRVMGTTTQMLDQLKSLVLRDRNHPSVIAWSIGNEEWKIEGNIKGARIAKTMQRYTKSLDPTRPVAAAVSGGREGGISTVVEIMGYNYLGQGTTDEHHKNYPWQYSMGTEEGSTHASRGIYEDDKANQYISAYDKRPMPNFLSIEEGWSYYAAREYLTGMFIWTGFDYRGESTPYTWPSVCSYFGMLDLCGFPKDDVYYLKSWWGTKPVLHILPHWNWKGKEGKEIDVWVYSNCEDVELFLNKKSLGKKSMTKNSHLEWKVQYAPGVLEARGYTNGKLSLTETVKTTGEAVALRLTPNSQTLQANHEDITVITVDALDKNRLAIPTAGNVITLDIQGPAKIIGVGNGDQTSHEPDRFLETVDIITIKDMKEKIVDGLENRPEIQPGYDDSSWNDAFRAENNATREQAQGLVVRGIVELPSELANKKVTFFSKAIGTEQSIYVNGKQIASHLNGGVGEFILDLSLLRAGRNEIAFVVKPLARKFTWENLNTDPGIIQVITPAPSWKRKLFSGMAQVIIQSTGGAGEVTIRASSPGLRDATLKITATPAVRRTFVNK